MVQVSLFSSMASTASIHPVSSSAPPAAVTSRLLEWPAPRTTSLSPSSRASVTARTTSCVVRGRYTLNGRRGPASGSPTRSQS
jgi:hypothetical protein